MELHRRVADKLHKRNLVKLVESRWEAGKLGGLKKRTKYCKQGAFFDEARSILVEDPLDQRMTFTKVAGSIHLHLTTKTRHMSAGCVYNLNESSNWRPTPG